MNTSKLILACVLFSSLLNLFLTSAFATSADDIRAVITARMHERHPDADPNFWSNLGTDAVPVLKNMYATAVNPIDKSYIIDGLAHFSDPSIAPLLQNAVQSSDNDVLKKKLLSALIESQGDSSFDFVEPYLASIDPHIRLAVARGMMQYMADLAAAQNRLTKYQAEEKEAWVKKKLQASAEDSNLRKRAGSVMDKPVAAFKPLEEKEWAGEWSGVWMSAQKNGQAKATLVYLPKEKAWKITLKLPKQTAYELKREGTEVTYFPSAHMHWLQVKNKKDDTVFLGQRKAAENSK